MRRITASATVSIAARVAPILAAALAAGCAVSVTSPPPGDGDLCVRLFQQFDLIEDTMSTPTGSWDRMTVPPPLIGPAAQLRQAGCITDSAALSGMESVDLPPVTGGGPAIEPIALHAGVVTSMEDDARARAYFEAHGVRARSVGSAALGRRIYLGPFATRNEIDGAATLARAAGFTSPYPARF